MTDFRLVLRTWGRIGTSTYNYREDIHKDGRVNARDLAVVAAEWD